MANQIDLDALAYVRNYYGVPAYHGWRVTYKGRPGTIVGGSGAYVKIKLDHEHAVLPYHPTWEIDYLTLGND